VHKNKHTRSSVRTSASLGWAPKAAWRTCGALRHCCAAAATAATSTRASRPRVTRACAGSASRCLRVATRSLSLDARLAANHAHCMQAAPGRAFIGRHGAGPHVPSRTWQAGTPRRLCACPAAPASSDAPPVGRRAAVPLPPSSVAEVLLAREPAQLPTPASPLGNQRHSRVRAGPCGPAAWLRAAGAVAVLQRAQARPSAGIVEVAKTPLLRRAPGTSCPPVTQGAPDSEQIVPQARLRTASPCAAGLAGTRERCMRREGPGARGAPDSSPGLSGGVRLFRGCE